MGWKLQHMGHAISEHKHGLVVAIAVSHCSPRAERVAEIAMMRRLQKWTKDISNTPTVQSRVKNNTLSSQARIAILQHRL